MSEIEAQDTQWLWQPYIPLGKQTLLEGDPGVGKSWASLAIAAAVSVGRGLPGIEPTEPGKVLLLTAEDGLGDTVKPRLEAVGADSARIFAIAEPLLLDEDGFSSLESYLAAVRPALVILDPLVAYLGAQLDLHRANEVRRVMAVLGTLAEGYQAAFLMIRHLTKGNMNKAIYRGLGSIDLTAACRSVLLAGIDPEDETKRAIVHIKSNLAPKGKSLGYALRDDNFYWTGTCSLNAAELLAAEGAEGSSALEEAIDFLKQILADGPSPTEDILKEAEELRIAERTLKRAKAELRIAASRQGETGKRGGGAWLWALAFPPEKVEEQSRVPNPIKDAKEMNGKLGTLNVCPHCGGPTERQGNADLEGYGRFWCESCQKMFWLPLKLVEVF